MRRALLLVPHVIFMTLATGCTFLAPSALAPSAEPERSYKVERGDTLYEIGVRFEVSPSDIQRYNGISNPSLLRAGQLLKIPAVGPLESNGARVSPSMSGDEKQDNKPPRMVDITGVRGYVGNLDSPVEGAQRSSHFGWRWRRFHEGVDLAAKAGTPILAAHDGVVVMASRSWGKYGRIVVIKGEGLMTVYAHNSRNRVDVGEQVTKGEHIADVGESGDATGNHLHFETRVRDESGRFAAVNPLVFYPQSIK